MDSSSQSPFQTLASAVRIAAVTSLAFAAALMVGALLGGLVRMGVSAGPTPESMVVYHGPLMVSAFFGAVISMERAVAIRKFWAYLAPLAAVAGGVCVVALGDPVAGGLLFLVAGCVLVAVFDRALRRAFEVHTLAMSIGAACWAVGNLLWVLGIPVSEIVPWWAAFLVLTIAGERLELSRLRLRQSSQTAFWFGFALAVVGLVATAISFDVGVRLLGVGFLIITAWLIRHDIARVTIGIAGAPRFMASALLAGYFWLFVAAALCVGYGAVHAGVVYDAIWHAVFVGFVFSMVFAHAQVILPALTGLDVEHGRRFYVPLVALHIAMAIRLVGGFGGIAELRRAGGILTAVAIGLFAVVLLTSIRRTTPPTDRRSPNRTPSSQEMP